MTHAEFVKELTETRRAFDDAVEAAQAADREAVYEAALKALDRLDPEPSRFRGCRVAGRVCLTLDEVVRAVVGE